MTLAEILDQLRQLEHDLRTDGDVLLGDFYRDGDGQTLIGHAETLADLIAEFEAATA